MPDRRQYLTVGVKLSVLIALVAGVHVGLQQFGTDGRSARIDSARFDISDLADGHGRMLLWRGIPVLVVRRTEAQLAALQDSAAGEELLDPLSGQSLQPGLAVNPHRSIEPAYLVVMASGTDQGCPIKLAGGDSHEPAYLVDGCRGSRYDLAGRVFRNQFADRNLDVPLYRFEAPGKLVLEALPQ